MKIFLKLIKNICLGVFAIYSFNIVFYKIGFFIPLNYYSLSMCSIFGIYGIFSFVALLILIN